MSVSARIRDGLIKPGSIYARFAELTPFETPIQEQRAVWLVRGILLWGALPADWHCSCCSRLLRALAPPAAAAQH